MRDSKFRGTYSPIRNLLLVVFFSCLSLLFCSKGHEGNIVVLPNPDNMYSGGGGETDSIYLDSQREPQDNDLRLNPQMSPIMSEETFNDIEKEVDRRIGSSKFPENQLMYLFSEPGEIAESNPPVICFAFAAPENSISAGDIDVILDGEDISKQVKYNYFYHQGRKVNYYLGHYIPENYLDPARSHQVDISFKPEKQLVLNKSIGFNAPAQDVSLKILRAGVVIDEKKNKTDFQKLVVFVNVPHYVKAEKQLLDLENWSFRYQSGASLPEIASLEQIQESVYIITFEREIESEKSIDISFSPAEGMKSQDFEFTSPMKEIEREGGSYRKAASSCLEGHFTYHNPHQAVDCEEEHYIDLRVQCPEPPCFGLIMEQVNGTSYTYHNNYWMRGIDFETGIAAGFYTPWYAFYCSNITFTYNHALDIRASFILLGYDEYGNYGLLDSYDPDTLFSDREPPVVTASVSKETLCPIENPNCTNCSGLFERYMITVTGEDDHCITDIPQSPKFCLFYPGEQIGDTVNLFIDIRHLPLAQDHWVERRFFIEQETLACVEYLKIVMWDLKGNWNSTKLYNGGHLPDELPFPSTLTMSFGENREGYKQYVNLDYTILDGPGEGPCNYFDDVCRYKIDNPDHGPYIYIEVSVDPPIEGIPFRLLYEDPLFQKGGNQPPTNDKTIGNEEYSSSNNPDLTDAEKKLLWGSHVAWGRYATPPDFALLGDNYNYYHNFSPENFDEMCDLYHVPHDDPIWTRAHPLVGPPDIPSVFPCFTNCPAPEGCVVLDCYCNAPFIDLSTNIHGKAAIFFNTMGHGGDNFKFKAIFLDKDNNKCVELESDIFTVWRTMAVDYAWMSDRNGTYPENCQPEEHLGDHRIGYDDFDYYKGVFDDCFIEVNKNDTFSDRPYALAINGVGGYTDITYASWWQGYYLKDKVLLLGIDHMFYECMNINYGLTVLNLHPHYYCYVSVGNRDDLFLNRNFEYIDGHKFGYLPDAIASLSIPCLNTGAHELTHGFSQIGDVNAYKYGLLHLGESFDYIGTKRIPTRRSYLHSGNIMQLRTDIYFDDPNY